MVKKVRGKKQIKEYGKSSFRLWRWEDQEKGDWRKQCKESLTIFFACLFWLWSFLQCFEIAIAGVFPSLLIAILILIYQWARQEGGKTLFVTRLLFGIFPLVFLLSASIRKEWQVIFHQMGGILAEKGVAFWKGAEGEMRPAVVWICIGSLFLWVIFLFCESYVKNSVILFFLVTLPVFFFIGRTGIKPGTIAVFFFILFCLSMLTPVLQETLTGTVLVLFISVLVFLFVPVSESSVSKGQAQWERWKYQENEEVLPAGDLTAAAKEKRGEDTALLIRMEKNSPYYLRGFVGSVYSANIWSNNKETLAALEKGIVYGADDLLDWLHSRKFYGANQLSLLTQDSMNLEKQTMQIKNVGADRRFLYLPYECDTEISSYEESGTAVVGAGEDLLSTGFRGRKRYQCSTYTPMVQAVSTLLSQQEEGNLTKEEEVYQQYVYQTCLALTKDAKTEISSVLEKKSGGSDLSLEAIVAEVKGWLKKQITYDTAPGAIPEGDSFTKWFLKDKKRGYDVQYASAAVMFFRYYGIPSRYVEGYLVTPEAIAQAEKGKETEITVKTEDAHAWPEIYADGIGWIPIEVTQGYENIMPDTYFSGKQEIISDQSGETDGEVLQEETQDTGTKQDTSDSEKRKEETPEAKEEQKEQKKEPANDEESGKDQSEAPEEGTTQDGQERSGSDTVLSEKEKTEGKTTDSSEDVSGKVLFWIKKIAQIVNGFIFFFVLFFLLLFLYRGWRFHLQEKKLIKEDDKMAVCLTYLQLYRLVEYLLDRQRKGKRWKNVDNRTRTLMKKLKELHREVSEEEMEKAFAIRQKAVYAPQNVTQEEKKAALYFFREEKNYLFNTMPFYQKAEFFLRTIFLVTEKSV